MPDLISISVNGARIGVTEGVTVAAALALAAQARGSVGATRHSVTGALRAPLCGMGVCQECRVTVDGRAHVLSCQTLCREGMQIEAAQ